MANITLGFGSGSATRTIPNADATRMLNALCVHRGIPATAAALAEYELKRLVEALKAECIQRERAATVIPDIPITA